MTDEGKPERSETVLTPEPPGLVRRVFAVLLLACGVPALLGSGYCTFYFVSGTTRMTTADLEFVLTIGGSGVVVSGLMVWGGWKLWRGKARHDRQGQA